MCLNKVRIISSGATGYTDVYVSSLRVMYWLKYVEEGRCTVVCSVE